MTHTKDSIYEYLCQVMEELFELDPSEIKPESQLYEELDIDSIDAVDMMVKLKQFTGKKISPSAFKDVRTVQDVVDAVFILLSEDQPSEAEETTPS